MAILYVVRPIGPHLEGKEAVPKAFEKLSDARQYAQHVVTEAAERADICEADGLDLRGAATAAALGTLPVIQPVYRKLTPEEAAEQERLRAAAFLRGLGL